jgi:hypothetical protein
MANRSLNISLGATIEPLKKSIELVGKMMADFAQSIAKTDSAMATSIKNSVTLINAEMAKVQQSFENTGKSGEKAGVSLRTQLRQATIEAQQAAEKFGMMSPEFAAASTKAAKLKDEMGDVALAIDAMNPDAKFKAIGNVMQGALGGFQAVTGAMTAFGGESKATQEAMAKLQGLMAMSQGLNALGGMKDAFGALRVQIMAAVGSMGILKVALIATGIGAIAVAVGYLYQNWGKVTEIVNKSFPILGTVGKALKGIWNTITDFVGATSDASRKLDSIMDNADKSLAKNAKFLALNSATLDEYTKKKIEATNKYYEEVKKETYTDKERVQLKKNLDNELNNIDKERTAVANKAQEDRTKKAQEEEQKRIEGNKKEKDDLIKSLEGIYSASQDLNKRLTVNPIKVKVEMEAPKTMKLPEMSKGNLKLEQDDEFSAAYNREVKYQDKVSKMTKTERAKQVQYNQAANAAISQSMQSTAELVGLSVAQMFSGDFTGVSFFKSMLNIVGDFASSLGKAFIGIALATDSFKVALGDAPGLAVAIGIGLLATGALIKNYAASLGAEKKGFAIGSRYVPYDMTAKIHEGEMIVPKAENPYANSGGKVLSGGGNSAGKVDIRIGGILRGSDMQLQMVKYGKDYGRITGRR